METGNNAPIGIFDSGIGGLTVMSAIMKRLPNESLIYLGDTARVPYGNKSQETVVRYSRECAHFLVERGVKAVVVACNTASAYALADLGRELSVPVIGVIEPGAFAAMQKTSKKTIGVIGTSGTVASNAYGKALKALDPKVRVVSLACPLFVPLVEEGWIDNDITYAIANRYLADMANEGIDVLILGCTHYPLLKKAIAEQVGGLVSLVDSAETTSLALKDCLSKNKSHCSSATVSHRIYVTDLPARFESVARLFLGCAPPSVTRVDL